MSYSGYPLRMRLKGVFTRKKRKLLEDKGFFKTMTGCYYNGHGRFIDKSEVRKLSYDELREVIRHG